MYSICHGAWMGHVTPCDRLIDGDAKLRRNVGVCLWCRIQMFSAEGLVTRKLAGASRISIYTANNLLYCWTIFPLVYLLLIVPGLLFFDRADGTD